jgi:hypothetical protein
MRLRVILLVVATSSLVLISFLVPLALVLRTLAADRAVSTATVQAQSLSPQVTTLPTNVLKLTVDDVNAVTDTPVTVFLPLGTTLGVPAPRSSAVQLAEKGRSFTAQAPGSTGWRSASANCSRTSGKRWPTCRTACGPR